MPAAPNTQDWVLDNDILVELPDANLDRWRQRNAGNCLHIDEDPSNQREGFYARVRESMREWSPAYNGVLNDLSGSPFTMCTGDTYSQGNTNFLYHSGVKAAILPSVGRTIGYFIAATAEETRHGWQDNEGMMVSSDTPLTRQGQLAEILMLEADGAAFAVLTAHELRLAGRPEAWEFIQNSNGHRAMADAFTASLDAAGVGTDEAASPAQYRDAMGAAFEAWMANPDYLRFYSERNEELLSGLPHSTATAGAEGAALTDRLPTAVVGEDRADLYFGSDQAQLAAQVAFQQIPVQRVAPALAR
ncbi:MAG: DUF6782 family putative metallopeptidase [Pseudomonadota bacterium]